MIHLTINETDPKQTELKNRLEELSLARKIIIDNTIESPFLDHDNKRFQGNSEISNYIVELQELLKKWYDCRCDKYE